MASSRRPGERALTVRIDEKLVARAREFVRNEAGRPLFLTMNKLIAAALERELQRLELVLGGALPPDRASGDSKPGDDEPPTTIPPPRRRLNSTPR